ncbi:MAG: helix-turn-helix transcriptional regulator [Acidimicrobiales bacterium]
MRARATALAEAEAAEASGNLTTASWLWHDALRLGAEGVAARLRPLAERTDSPLVAARAAHAEALERSDATGLRAAAAAFEALGADLLAAEARTGEADAWRRAGDGRATAAAEREATTLLERCEGARSPAARPAAAADLTKREREVAALAATGLSAPDIAERLFVSPRTVENHLQKAYAKLGVRSRAELAAALADA